MTNFKFTAAILCILPITACDVFSSSKSLNFGSRTDVPMVSSTGVDAGATSTDLIRKPISRSQAVKAYRVGASNLPDEMLVKSTATTGNFNSFQSAIEISLPFGKEETSQIAARMADNLGLNARVSGGSIVMGGAVLPPETLSFAQSDTTLSQSQLSACYMRLGSCRTELKINSRVLPVMVQTGHQNGRFYQTVRTSDAGYFRRSKLLSHTVFSVDQSGTLIDLNTVSYATKEPLMQYVRRVQ